MTYSRRAADMIVADSFEGLGHRHKRALLRAVGSDDAEHIKYEQFLIKSLGDGVYNKVKRALFDGAYREKVLLGLERSGVGCVVLGDGGYPPLLAEIPAPPLVLYCRGNIDLLSGDCFTVVGSRRTPAATAKPPHAPSGTGRTPTSSVAAKTMSTCHESHDTRVNFRTMP